MKRKEISNRTGVLFLKSKMDMDCMLTNHMEYLDTKKQGIYIGA